jgi:hypothetical protein
MSSPGYELRGEFFELCDCFTICPCWLGQPPDDNRCTGAFGWSVASGHVGGVDLAGRSVVSVSFHTGHRDGGGQQVYVFVDDGADDDQYRILVDTFTGQNGGPLGELGALMGVLQGHERAPIQLASRGNFITVTVGRAISGDAGVVRGGDGEVTTLEHGRLSEVLGTPAEVGLSTAFRMDVAQTGISIEVRGRAAMRGAFTYRSEGE